MNNKYLDKAIESGLLDVIKDWIKSEKYVSVSRIQREFSVGFITANSIIDYLKDNGIVEKETTDNKGYKVTAYNPSSSMKIYLLDINEKITKAWENEFKECDNVFVVKDDFAHFMKTYKDIECIVSPANSFGYMNGGYDEAITNYFGLGVEKEVRRFIDKNLFGEQPVGTSIMVNIPNTSKKLIHTPTMRLPSPILDYLVIYQCMRTTLMMAINNRINSIVIPAFGGSTGKVLPDVIAKYMKSGYKQVMEYLKREPF